MSWMLPEPPPMSDAEAAKWAGIRARGRRRYLLVSGALGWGLPFALAFTTVKHLVTPGPAPFWGTLAISIIVFPTGGFWQGRRDWSANERRYLERRDRSPESTTTT